MVDVYEFVITQLGKILSIINCTLDTTLKELDVNSYIFIKLVVEIEIKYNIEFDDDFLDYTKFITVRDVCQYAETQINKSK
mgnify:CR=1 FL=1